MGCTHGNARRALIFYKKAYEQDRSRIDILERSALTASRLGLHAEAAEAYAELARRSPNDPRWPAAIGKEKSHADWDKVVSPTTRNP